MVIADAETTKKGTGVARDNDLDNGDSADNRTIKARSPM